MDSDGLRPVERMGRCSLAGLGLVMAVLVVVRAEEDSLTGGPEQGDTLGHLGIVGNASLTSPQTLRQALNC